MHRILLLLAVASTPLLAQQAHLSLLQQKTAEQILASVQHSRCVMGVAAFDLSGNQRFAVNDTLVFPTASAIKVTILMEVYKQAHEGKFKLGDTRPVEHEKTVDGGILRSFGDGQSRLSIHDLCVLMIVLSDNSATNMLIDLVGMENVNATLRSLGMTHTRLQRKMMDIQASARGDENISTPDEAARIMGLLGRGAFINKETSEAILTILQLPKESTGNIPRPLPEGVVVACKQGTILPAVTTEWALVRLKDHPYVLAVMSNYGLDDDDAAAATREISKAVYDYFWRAAVTTPHGTYNDPALWK